MKKLCALVALLALVSVALPTRADASFSLVASTCAGGDASTVTTSAIDTTGANLVAVTLVFYQVSGAPNISDSKSNTPTGNGTQQDSASGLGEITYWYVAPTVGSGHTFTSTAAFPVICVSAWSGGKASGTKDQEAGANGVLGTIQAGSVTPSMGEDCELIIASVGVGGTVGAVTPDGGFTPLAAAPVAGAAFQGSQAYLIQTTATAANPTWTVTAGGYGNAATNITFKAASTSCTGGGGGPPVGTLNLLGVGR